MLKAQNWLHDQPEYNSKDKREKVEKLNINKKELEGGLNLNDFAKLRELYCDNNKLTKLDLSRCLEIKEIYCQKNQLKDLVLPSNSNSITHLNMNGNSLDDKTINENGETIFGEVIFKKLSSDLVYLDIRDNKFSQKNLSFLSRFEKLEVLKLGRKRVDLSFALETIWSHEDRHLNSFGGSLEPLKNMHELDKLSIINTDINGGLQYLPSNLKKIRCGTTIGRGISYKCSEICKELKEVKGCYMRENEYDFQVWRKEKYSEIIQNSPETSVDQNERNSSKEEERPESSSSIEKKKGKDVAKEESRKIENLILSCEKEIDSLKQKIQEIKSNNMDIIIKGRNKELEAKEARIKELEEIIETLKQALKTLETKKVVENDKLDSEITVLGDIKEFLKEKHDEMVSLKDVCKDDEKSLLDDNIKKYKDCYETKIVQVETFIKSMKND